LVADDEAADVASSMSSLVLSTSPFLSSVCCWLPNFDDKRHASGVGQDVPLRSGSTSIYRIRTGPCNPLFAGTLAESKLALDQPISPALPSSSSSTRCKRLQTPAFCRSLSRLHHVTPLPKPSSLGNIPVQVCMGHTTPRFFAATVSRPTAASGPSYRAVLETPRSFRQRSGRRRCRAPQPACP
jgi:hypothetical protein